MKKIVIKLVSAVLALSILTACNPADTVNQGLSSEITDTVNQSLSSEGADTVNYGLSSESEQWKLLEAINPQNNPEPASIAGEDDIIIVPMSFTDKIVGRKIKSEVRNVITIPQLQIECMGGCTNHDHVAVIRSYDELKSIYDDDVINLRDDQHYIDFYDAEHFDDNVVIMLISEWGASKHKIDKVTKDGNRMYIYWNNADSSVGDNVLIAAVANCSRSLISVSKKDMEDINDIVVYMDKIRCD